jgi:hypothetical protein
MPTLRASLEAHTVDVRGRRVAGYLVRCSASRREMGYVWQMGNAWGWQTPTAKNYGERSSRHAAVKVLRDVFDLQHDISRARQYTPLPTDQAVLDSWRAPRRASSPASSTTPPAAPTPRPAPVKQQIDWSTSTTSDLTSAIADALKRTK